MFTKHRIVFVTFHPSDAEQAALHIPRLSDRLPGHTFLGRHLPDQDPEHAIARATLSVILETKKTYASPRVRGDIEASLAKRPPNSLLRICMDESNPPDSGTLSLVVAQGCEAVGPDPQDVESAIERAERTYKLMPKLAASAASGSGGDCGRNA